VKKVNDTITTRDKAVIAIKNLTSILPKIGIMHKPNYHPEGITFIIATKNEERWIKPSIQSIADVANEIIVIDSTTNDNTTKIAANLAEYNNKIRHIRFYQEGIHSFALSLHIGLINAQYKWVFKWDSDLIAKSPEAMTEWMDRVQTLDKNRYHYIDVPRINIEGDLYHQPKNEPFGAYEGRIYTWNPQLKYGLKPNYYEQLLGDSIYGYRIPLFFKMNRWHEPYIFHMNIKTPQRMLNRLFWGDYMSLKATDYKTLDEYTEYRVKHDWNLSVKEAQTKVLLENQKNLIPYDEKRFGELPKLLIDNEKSFSLDKSEQ
jgi:glycosyltransferase involved in cell wall biosynthesis